MMIAKRNDEIGQGLFSPQRTGSKVQFLHRAGVPYDKGKNLIQWSLNCDQRILGAPRAHFLCKQGGKYNFDDFEVIYPVV
jgi:hypothetical protein